MRLPSTLITCCCGSTRAPYRRRVSPSTSTRPSPISSSQRRRLPTPAAASTFCSRTPPGTSMRLSRSSSGSSSSGSSPSRAGAPPVPGGRPPGLAPRRAPGGRPPGLAGSGPLALINRILDVLDVLGQEGGESRELLQAGQTEPLQEVPGSAVEDGPRLGLGARLLDPAAQGEGAQHEIGRA